MKIIHNEDNDQITFLDERFYLNKDTGNYQPSATHILNVYPKGYGYTQWLKDLGHNADEVLRKAQEQGTNVHDAIERYLNGEDVSWTNGEKDNYTLDEWLMVLKFVDFYNTYKPEVIAIEESLVDDDLGFGGTLDLVCKINGEVWYIDYKSGSAIYKSNKIQGAAYCQLWNKNRDTKIERIGCMHLRAKTRGSDKSGKNIQGEGWKIDESNNIEHLFRLFEHARALWKEENPNPKPKNVVYPDRIKLNGKK